MPFRPGTGSSGSGGLSVINTTSNGSAGAPAITGTDTDTGMWFDPNTIYWSAGGTTVMAMVASILEPAVNGTGALGEASARWGNGYINTLIPQAFNPTRTITAGGTTGNQTIDKMAGTVNFAAGASSLTVTNSLVNTSSIIFCTIRTGDATALLKNVVPGSGSFVITLNAVTTGETSVGFFVTN